MKIDDLLRKLQPLLPQEVSRWRRALDLADEELRRLLERQIMLTAHKRLAGFHDRLLLSLPPRRTARGELALGTVVYEEEKWPAGLAWSEVLQNMAIFGRSGAGKTNVTFHLLQQLHRARIPFVYLDWKRTARHLLPSLGGDVQVFTPGRSLSPFPFNPFVAPPGLEPMVYANHVIDLLADAYTLGDGARSVLQQALQGWHATHDGSPTPADVLAAVRAVPDKERVRGWKISAIRALESLALGSAAADVSSQEAMVQTLAQRSTIVELDAVPPSTKQFLLPLLCLWLYYVKLPDARREELGIVLFVEEAHHVFYQRQGRESLMEMLLRQCREIGIAMIVIDQHPHLISSATLGNTYTSICMNLKDPKDARKAAALSLLDEEEARHLTQLPVGHGIVKLQDRWRRPFLVRFPHVALQKGAVTDELLRAYLRREVTLSGLGRLVAAKSVGEGRSRVTDEALSPEELSFVHDLLHHPDDGVDHRYKRLGLSADKGNRLKQRLVASGIIEEQGLNIGRTRRTLLRVAARAAKTYGLTNAWPDHGSLIHEYWKRWYARSFSKHGYNVRLEAPRSKGRVDVLATRGAESVAIEVETGKSDAIENVKQNLRMGYTRILIIATDNEAQQRVERQLAAEGLILERIQVVFREKHELGSDPNHSSP